MTDNAYLIKGRISGGLIRFALPVMLASVLQLLYAAVDMAVVGNFATPADMSAVGIGGQVMLTVLLGITGLTTGLTVLIGQFTGAGNNADTRAAHGAAVLFFLALSAALTAIFVSLTNPIIAVMNTPPEAVLPAQQYLRITSSGIVFVIGYNVVGSMFRGLGNSKTPLIFVMIATAINITLDLLFVAVFGMGAAGAAIATISAQAGSLGFAVLYIRRHDTGICFSRAELRWRGDLIGKMLRVGTPLALQEILVNFSFLLITAVVNKNLGLVASAAVLSVEKIVSFLMMPTLALSIAVATMSAHNFGAGQLDRSRKTMWTGVIISLSIGVVACAVCWLSGETLTRLFSKDQPVVIAAAHYLKSYSLDCIFVSFVFNFNAYFSSCNRSLFSMAHSLVTTFAIRVPFVIITGGIAGVTLFTIGFAAPLSSLGSLIMCLIYFAWLNRKLSAEKAAAPIVCETD